MAKQLKLIWLLTCICFGLSGCGKNYISNIRTDSEPITEQFPSLPIPDRMYWQHAKQSGMGLDHQELTLFLFYPDVNQFNTVKGQLISEQKVFSIEPAFLPEELENQSISWNVAKTYAYFQEEIVEPKAVDAYWCDEEQVVYLFMSWD